MQTVSTIIAPATPAGESALAVVRISGPLASELASVFHGNTAPPPRHAWYTNYRALSGAVVDDAVFCYFAAPNSYTGEDSLEISCHGNPFIVSKIIEDGIARGLRVAEPGEFTKRAFLSGRLDLTEAEAVMDLIRARSDRALDLARCQLQGALRQRIDGLVDRLLDLCAALEAHVDFPEEDLPVANRDAWRQGIEALATELQTLAATRRDGDRLRDGVRVVLVGEPNVGKSSLLNRLVGFDRAIVSEEPGTTRDFLEERISLGGYCIRIFDTAGIREAVPGVERDGVQRTIDRLRDADVVVLVTDLGRPAPEFSGEVQALLNQSRLLVAGNKADLGARLLNWPTTTSGQIVEVSAVTGFGVENLRASLADLVSNMVPQDTDDEIIAINSRHESCLAQSQECLRRAGDLLHSSPATELVAIELRAGMAALRDIVGIVDHEKVLDRIFSAFCIGK